MNNVVLSEQKGSIRILTLNRPGSLNAINAELITALRLALTEANADDETRVIILHGAGRAFCTGNDMKESESRLEAGYSAEEARADARELQEVTRQIVLNEKIVIAAINGWAVGAGFEWAINCDFTVWAEDARAFFPELSWGLFATGGVMSLLSRTVGITRAREMLLLGEKYDAQALQELGLAWRVVPEPMIMQTALQAAEQIAVLPNTAVRRFKKTFNEAIYMDFEQTLAAEVEALVAGITSTETEDLVKEFGKTGNLTGKRNEK